MPKDLSKPSKALRPPRSKKVALANDADLENFAGRRLRVDWNDLRTNRLLDWLDDHPEDRNRLFSDSTAAAKEEKRPKVTAKGSKNRYHVAMAKAVFDCEEEDDDMREWYRNEPAKFTSSLSNYINR
jgi:hypothetical protein